MAESGDNGAGGYAQLINSISSLFGNNGGGSNSFGPGEAFDTLQATNPGFSSLRWLFGKGKGPKAGSILFGETGENFKSNLQRLLGGPLTFGAGQPGILESILGSPQQIQSGLQGAIGDFDAALGTARQFNETGLPTDASAIYSDANRRFLREYLPQIAEQSGLGTRSSGFQAQSAGVAGDLLSEAAKQQVGLQEAATQRRMTAAPLLSSLSTARQSLPVNLANDLSALYGQDQTRGLGIFGAISSLGQNLQFAQGGYNPQGSGSSALAGLPGLINSLSGLIQPSAPTTNVNVNSASGGGIMGPGYQFGDSFFGPSS